MPVFTIRTQASDISDISDTYPYIYWLPDYKSLIVSKRALGGYTIEDSNGILLRNLDENVYERTNTTKAYLLTISNYQQGDCYTLVYNEVTGWEARQPMMCRQTYVATVYTAPMVTLYSGERVYTNGQSVPSPYSSAGTSLPSDIPKLDNVQNAINDALNATTATTTEANTIQSNIGITYVNYTEGLITQAEFQAAMNEYQQQLEELAGRTGNTLADQVAVNNAITYAQTVQINVTQTASAEIAKALSEALTNVTNVYQSFINGQTTEATATSEINQYVNQITNLMQQTKSVADIEAINAALAAINGYKESIADSGDLDKSVSDSAESSDQEEIELLNDMLGIMQEQETDNIMQNQQMKNDLGEVSDFIEPLWINPFIRDLIISFIILVPLCSILDMRYRHL